MDDGNSRTVVVDTDTAGDDTQALMMAATADRLDLAGVTICAGNVQFDYQVENAKHTLDVAGRAADVTVYEGARSPLLKEHDFADYVHGEGGLGGDLFPDTRIESGDRHAVDFIVETAREAPGEVTLACIAPLTNVALALQREPDLNALLDEVWVMGGNVNCLGNVTPAAEYNFWVDPDAAKVVMRELDVTLFDWGLTMRDAYLDADALSTVEENADTKFAEYFLEVNKNVRQHNRETFGEDFTSLPDSALTASLVEPGLIEQTGQYHVDVDEREGMTRGYSSIDELGVTDRDARTRVVESLDGSRLEQLFRNMLFRGSPESHP